IPRRACFVKIIGVNITYNMIVVRNISVLGNQLRIAEGTKETPDSHPMRISLRLKNVLHSGFQTVNHDINPPNRGKTPDRTIWNRPGKIALVSKNYNIIAVLIA